MQPDNFISACKEISTNYLSDIEREYKAYLIRGPGGSGKTRMAYEIARHLQRQEFKTHSIAFRAVYLDRPRYSQDFSKCQRESTTVIPLISMARLKLMTALVDNGVANGVCDADLSNANISQIIECIINKTAQDQRSPNSLFILNFDECQRAVDQIAYSLRVIREHNRSPTTTKIVPILSGTWLNADQLKSVYDISDMVNFPVELSFFSSLDDVRSLVHSAATGYSRLAQVLQLPTDEALGLLMQDTRGWPQAAVQLGAELGDYLTVNRRPADPLTTEDWRKIESNYVRHIGRKYPSLTGISLLHGKSYLRKLVLVALSPFTVSLGLESKRLIIFNHVLLSFLFLRFCNRSQLLKN